MHLRIYASRSPYAPFDLSRSFRLARVYARARSPAVLCGYTQRGALREDQCRSRVTPIGRDEALRVRTVSGRGCRSPHSVDITKGCSVGDAGRTARKCAQTMRCGKRGARWCGARVAEEENGACRSHGAVGHARRRRTRASTPVRSVSARDCPIRVRGSDPRSGGKFESNFQRVRRTEETRQQTPTFLSVSEVPMMQVQDCSNEQEMVPRLNEAEGQPRETPQCSKVKDPETA